MTSGDDVVVVVVARYRLDRSVQRFGTTVIGGSPLKLFRLTPKGADVLDRIEAGEAVPTSKLVTSLIDAGAIHPDPSDGPYGPEDVTIVVPTLGPPANVPPGAIVVDDGSIPAVVEATVRLDTNRGAGAARNAGLGLVTTPLVAFVDADVELPDRWIDRLLPHFADERVGLVAPRVTTPADEGSVRGAYEADHSPLDLGDQPARIRAGTRVSYVPAAAIVCRVEALRDLDGFDTGLRFGEDVDLLWRLDAAGWHCRYEPTSIVRHPARRSWAGWARQRIDYGSSAAPLAKRHPGALAPLRMSGWSIGAWFLVAARQPVLGVALGVGSAAALIEKLPDVPPRDAFRLAALGNLYAGDQLAAAIRRVWWPLLLIASIRSRFARRVLVAALLAARRPLVAADDVAYSVGVWGGMIARRTIDPLIPEITRFPGR